MGNNKKHFFGHVYMEMDIRGMGNVKNVAWLLLEILYANLCNIFFRSASKTLVSRKLSKLGTGG